MRRPHLLVIDPSSNIAEIQGAQQVLWHWSGLSTVVHPVLNSEGPSLNALGCDFDGIVLMGSAASVYDPLPWLDSLKDWLQPLLSGDIQRPLLGICFGHQLISMLAGGHVAFIHDDHHKHLHVEESHFNNSRLLPNITSLRVLVSHREHVDIPPPHYRTVASRDRAPHDALEHPSLPIFSFQFHPEAREAFASRAGLDPKLIDAQLHQDGQRVLSAFRDLVFARFTSLP